MAAADCQPVTGTRILGRHLAQADSRLAFVPPDVTISYAPAPGSQRMFRPDELTRIMRRWHGDNFTLEPICFVYPAYSLDPGELAAAIRRATGAQQVELIEHSRFPAPRGEIEFQPSPSGRSAADGSRLYRGVVRYAGTKTQTIWARALCRYRTRRIVALSNIAAGMPIDPQQIELRELDTTEKDATNAGVLEEVIGRASARPILAGESINPKLLRIPPAVQRGDRVRVEVRSGRARVSLDTIAESAGRQGERVLLRDSASGRRFRASVASQGSATINVSPGAIR
jgi:flagella basal body P-ring formation protein FlgA